MTDSNHHEPSPKERVLKTINLEEPDRVPVYITITPQVAETLSQVLGIPRYTHPDSPLAENRISYTELLLKLGNDIPRNLLDERGRASIHAISSGEEVTIKAECSIVRIAPEGVALFFASIDSTNRKLLHDLIGELNDLVRDSRK